MTIPKLTKIVCVSDTHDRYDDFQMPAGDILLHAGDATFNGRPEEIIRFNKWLERLNFKHKIIIPGNHDLCFEEDFEEACARMPGADHILNGTLVEVEGLKIWGEPRQPWFHDWAFNVQREAMKEVWDRIPPDIDVLLTHGPPFGYGDLTPFGQHVGCEYQTEWIMKNQPRLVVCGHIHNGRGQYLMGKTLLVNASVCNERYQATNEPVVLYT